MRRRDCRISRPAGSVGGLDRRVAEVAQHLDDQAAHHRLVLDHQHRLARFGGVGGGHPGGLVDRLGRAAVARQVELERRALAHLAVDLGVALGLAGEAVDHRQPQPRALPQGLGGEERLEGLGHGVGAHSRAGVGDADADVLAGAHLALPGGVGAVEVGVAGLDGQLAAVGHGVAGVDGEVEDGVLQLVRIAACQPQAARQHELQLDPLAEGFAEAGPPSRSSADWPAPAGGRAAGGGRTPVAGASAPTPGWPRSWPRR